MHKIMPANPIAFPVLVKIFSTHPTDFSPFLARLRRAQIEQTSQIEADFLRGKMTYLYALLFTREHEVLAGSKNYFLVIVVGAAFPFEILCPNHLA